MTRSAILYLARRYIEQRIAVAVSDHLVHEKQMTAGLAFLPASPPRSRIQHDLVAIEGLPEFLFPRIPQHEHTPRPELLHDDRQFPAPLREVRHSHDEESFPLLAASFLLRFTCFSFFSRFHISFSTILFFCVIQSFPLA